MFRKILFWAHLVCGVVTGLVIVMMSVTGVILTYERQMLQWADARSHDPIAMSATRQPIESLLENARLHDATFQPTSVVIPADPATAVIFSAGRGGGSLFIDPYSGDVLGEGATGTHSFFRAVTGWHRWFNKSGDERAPWRAVTGISNLGFLFLLVSGLYLWLPKIINRAALRVNLWFNPKVNSAKARDYNWHHVFGFWTAIPLIIVVATAVVFSYRWPGELINRTFSVTNETSEEVVAERIAIAAAPAESAGSGLQQSRNGEISPNAATSPLSFDSLVSIAAAQLPEWQRITLQLPRDEEVFEIDFSLDAGNGGQPQMRAALSLDRMTGEVTQWEPFAEQPSARQIRSWIRFLHTGEALGLTGQTVAGLVSLLSVLMVWTGLALAYRRLISPLFKRGVR